MRRRLTDRPTTIPLKRSRAALARFGCARWPLCSGMSIQASLIFFPVVVRQVSLLAALDGDDFANLKKSRSPQHQEEDQTEGSGAKVY